MTLKPIINIQTGEIELIEDTSGKVPYIGATADVDLSISHSLTASSVITGNTLIIPPIVSASCDAVLGGGQGE